MAWRRRSSEGSPMDEQVSSIDEAFGQPADPAAERIGVRHGGHLPVPGALFWDPTKEGKEPSMNQHESSEEAPAASLVGSLAAFSLSDILSMLASTKQTGELQVVSEATDGKVWLADGELSNANVGAAATIGQAVFELACISEGWFYFTGGRRVLERAAHGPGAGRAQRGAPPGRRVAGDPTGRSPRGRGDAGPRTPGPGRPDPQRPVAGADHGGHQRALGTGGDRPDRWRPDRRAPHPPGPAHRRAHRARRGPSDQVAGDSELAFEPPVDHGAEIDLAAGPSDLHPTSASTTSRRCPAHLPRRTRTRPPTTASRRAWPRWPSCPRPSPTTPGRTDARDHQRQRRRGGLSHLGSATTAHPPALRDGRRAGPQLPKL